MQSYDFSETTLKYFEKSTSAKPQWNLKNMNFVHDFLAAFALLMNYDTLSNIVLENVPLNYTRPQNARGKDVSDIDDQNFNFMVENIYCLISWFVIWHILKFTEYQSNTNTFSWNCVGDHHFQN